MRLIVFVPMLIFSALLICVEFYYSVFGPEHIYKPYDHRPKTNGSFIEMLGSTMNTKANPCDDFYQFSCGLSRRNLIRNITKHLFLNSYMNFIEKENEAGDSEALINIRGVFKGCLYYKTVFEGKSQADTMKAFRNIHKSYCFKELLENYEIRKSFVAEYAYSEMSPAKLSYLDGMFQKIRTQFMSRLEKNITWLSSAKSKIMAMKKISNVHPVFGSHENFRLPVRGIGSYNVTLGKFIYEALHGYTDIDFGPPAHNSIFNAVLVSTPFMMYTNLDLNRPDVLNHAILGSMIGHEIVHSIDPQIEIATSDSDDSNKDNDSQIGRAEFIHGQCHDGGTCKEARWDQQGYEDFKNRARCLVSQYTGLNIYTTYDDLSETNIVSSRQSNGIETFREDFADNVGFLLAYRAFFGDKSALRHDDKTWNIKGITFNERQLYWLGVASFMCDIPGHDLIVHNDHNDHSPSRYRLNKPLSNFQEFARDFRCPTGSGMNPEVKCSFV